MIYIERFLIGVLIWIFFVLIKRIIKWSWKPKSRVEYEKEMKRIEDYKNRRKSPDKIPWRPWAYYCKADIDYTKYQRW